MCKISQEMEEDFQEGSIILKLSKQKDMGDSSDFFFLNQSVAGCGSTCL